MRPDEATRGAIPPVPSADQPMPPKLLDYQPVFDAALPPEWELIGRSRGSLCGHAEPADGLRDPFQGGCFVLAHPAAGVALVDLLPDRTPNAEALFRRLLNAVDFSARCRGYLPVIHVAVGPDELPTLLGRIEDGFGYDSVLTIADRGQWVGELWRILQSGITWEALGRPPSGRTPAILPVKGERWALPARLARASLLAGGLFGLFGLGFAAALLLPPPPEAPPQPAPTGLSALAAVAPAREAMLTPCPPRWSPRCRPRPTRCRPRSCSRCRRWPRPRRRPARTRSSSTPPSRCPRPRPALRHLCPAPAAPAAPPADRPALQRGAVPLPAGGACRARK
ncbi:hypothetical protein ACFQY5_27825 [Paeniroseomonas aquatica]|uniref:hypothetical protein n=1 Tax=Paeniroseomonas aquatica TaxID=373043 RepID=UPI00361B4885